MHLQTVTPAQHWAKRRKILVTGGCGFIGSALVRKLVAAGESVIALDSMRFGNLHNLGDALQQVKTLRFQIGVDDLKEVAHELSDVTHAFHLAAEKSNQPSATSADFFRGNIEGMHTLISLLCQSGLLKVVFTSSLYAYGRHVGGPLCEDELAQPNTLYGMSKLAGENLLGFFRREYHLEACGLRVFFTYGPRQFPGSGYKSVIIKNFERILDGRPPVIFGDGQQALDYIFVDDVVDALLAAMVSSADQNVINVGSGVGTTIERLTDMMLDVAGSALKPEFAAADWTAGTTRVADRAKAAELLHWEPTTTLRHGLGQTLVWMKERVKV